MMWSKLRKRLLQPKPVVVEQSGQRLASDCNHVPGSCSCATGERALPNIDANESYLQVHDVQEDQCRCSPLHQIQKHLFGTFRTKKTSDQCSVSGRIDELGEGSKNQDVDAVNLSLSSDGFVNGVSIPLKDNKSKVAEFDSSKCTCVDVSVDDRIIKDQSLRLKHTDFSLESKENDQLTIDKGFTTLSSCEVMQASSSRLKMQGRNDDATESTASAQHQDKDVEISSSFVDQKVLEHPANDTEGKSCCTGIEINGQMINISDSADANNAECCSEKLLPKGEDKEGSTDSGHHLSDGDAEKDPGSPDLEPDDCDGRESGYTTFDEVQLIPLELAKLCNRNNMYNNVFEEEHPADQVQVSDHMFYYSQPLDLSLSAGELGGRPAGCFDWSPAATVLNSLVKGSPDREATSVETVTVGLGDADGVSSRRWKEVDYVPADACVSKIYEDNSASGAIDVYAIVPRNGNSKLEEASISEAFACRANDLPERRMETPNQTTCEQGDLDSCSAEAGSLPVNGEKSSGGNSIVSDASVIIALDSDDGENVPPLPQRNYGLYVGSEDAESKCSKFVESDNENEQIHMTWDELMKEAKDMGIPLNGPHCDNSSVYVASGVFIESEFSISQIPDTNNRSSKEQQELALDKTTTGKTELKKGSPIKEKFRLPNLFVRKNRSTKTETVMKNDKPASAKEKKSSIFRHHSSVDIQKRCLPCLPPSEQQRDSSFLIIDQAGCSDGQMSSHNKTHRMAVSMHLPISDGDSWESSTNMACGDTNGQRARRIFSDSSQWNNSSCASMLSFGDPENGAANCSDLSASDNRNVNADFIQSFSKLKDCGWYWGPLGWENAEAKLEDKPDGSFLVRDSSDDRYILSLSFRSQNVTHHTRIEHYKGKFSFYSQPKSHGVSTIVEFIEKAMEHSQSGRFLYFLRPRAPGLPPTPVQLLFPISRLRNMHSLQHMCRFVILKHVRRDLIDCLPMPQRLKEYLRQTQYYVEHSDCDSMGHQYFSPAW